MAAGRSFAATDRFIAEVEGGKLRAAYVLIGDEVFFRDRCRAAVIQHLVAPDLREFSLYDLDLSDISIAEILDRAQTPSLMAPFQVFFIRGVKNLYGRGSHKEEFAAVEAYCKNPNPNALLIFVADHLSIPADVRRMDMQDKDRYDRIRETLGEVCGIIELGRVDEGDGIRWVVETGQAQGVKVEQDSREDDPPHRRDAQDHAEGTGRRLCGSRSGVRRAARWLADPQSGSGEQQPRQTGFL